MNKNALYRFIALASVVVSIVFAAYKDIEAQEDSSLSFFDEFSAPDMPADISESPHPHESEPEMPLQPNVTKPNVTEAPQDHVQAPAPSSSRSTASIHNTQRVDKLHELREFQVELAKAAFDGNKSLYNRAALVYAHEQQLGPECMPRLFHDLQFTSKELSSECISRMQKVRELDWLNPHLACIEGGIDSAQCKHRFEAQSVGVIEDESDIPRDSLNAKLNEASNSALMSLLREKLRQVMDKDMSEPSDATQRERRTLMKQIIENGCKVVVISLSPASEDQNSAPDANGAGLDPLKTLVESIAGSQSKAGSQKAPAPTVNPRHDFDIFGKSASSSAGTSSQASPAQEAAAFRRKRLISRSCASDIAASLELYPDFPAAICYRDGLYSPSCIESLRKARSELQPKIPAAPQQKGGSGTAGPGRKSDGLKSF